MLNPKTIEIDKDGITYLVSKSLLLEVQAGTVERGTLGSGGEDGSPGRDGALHYG